MVSVVITYLNKLVSLKPVAGSLFLPPWFAVRFQLSD